jgi:RNA polymerase sigma-70 factor (ECF subfamily)
VKPLPDKKLIADQRFMEAVAAGDARAQRELVERLWQRVHNTARYLSRCRVDAEDLAQEALLQIITAAKSYRAQGCLEAWADMIAARTIRRQLRRLRRSRWLHGAALPRSGDLRNAEAVNPELQLLRKTCSGRLGELLARLSERQHLALVLKTVNGYSVQEVADLMQERPETVRYLVRKGRAKLRRLALKDPVFVELLLEKAP